ncbi:HD-domain/PDEase-like protein [Gonapodya prolifera JEL478]|uniref:HD-domain/PDEase-like protein n=1 Tax=Gonapodya prolifera (strain JEL478) TaxID=1344416 RepID=A0A139A2P8_GONPJ|nr:HD-domain/PDEase-like protein [Gonapodya prolifera JEL478]|eukprot:KXS11042.1 HD-domain/PDEase-like protein [Gonapodya prolifera JEL478]
MSGARTLGHLLSETAPSSSQLAAQNKDAAPAFLGTLAQQPPNLATILPTLQAFVDGTLVGIDFSFNPFAWTRDELYAIVAGIFVRLGLVNHPTKLSVLLQFVAEIAQSYQNNPYHNWYHAVDVTFITYYILTEYQISIYFSKLEACAILVSALGHDAHHPGTSNLFQINARTPVALKYNNVSVLESQSLDFLVALVRKYDLFRKLLFDEEGPGGFAWSSPTTPASPEWTCTLNESTVQALPVVKVNNLYGHSPQLEYSEPLASEGPTRESNTTAGSPRLRTLRSFSTSDGKRTGPVLHSSGGNLQIGGQPGHSIPLRASRSFDNRHQDSKAQNSNTNESTDGVLSFRAQTPRWLPHTEAGANDSATSLTPSERAAPSPELARSESNSTRRGTHPLSQDSGSLPMGATRLPSSPSSRVGRRSWRKGASSGTSPSRSRVRDALSAAEGLVGQCVLETDMKTHFEMVKKLDALSQRVELEEKTTHLSLEILPPMQEGDTAPQLQTQAPRQPQPRNENVARAATIHFRMPSEVADQDSAERFRVTVAPDRSSSPASITAPTVSPQSVRKLEKPDRHLLLCAILHAADISNAGRPWAIAKMWSDLVVEEFLAQGDEEKRLGLPVSPNMDRDTAKQLTISLGFIDYVSKPFFDVLADFLPVLDVFAQNLIENRQMWLSQTEEAERKPQTRTSFVVKDLRDNNFAFTVSTETSTSSMSSTRIETHRDSVSTQSDANSVDTSPPNGEVFSGPNVKDSSTLIQPQGVEPEIPVRRLSVAAGLIELPDPSFFSHSRAQRRFSVRSIQNPPFSRPYNTFVPFGLRRILHTSASHPNLSFIGSDVMEESDISDGSSESVEGEQLPHIDPGESVSMLPESDGDGLRNLEQMTAQGSMAREEEGGLVTEETGEEFLPHLGKVTPESTSSSLTPVGTESSSLQFGDGLLGSAASLER